MNIEAQVKDKINALWAKYKNEWFCELPPRGVSNCIDEGLVFIGINPSISEVNRAALLESNDKAMSFYHLDGKSPNRYFAKFEEIANKLKVPWGHIDLLYIQETNQKRVELIIRTDAGRDFIYQQLMISKDVILELMKSENPLIFIVNNALAREYLGKGKPEGKDHWMNFEFTFSKTFGTDLCNDYPFFFTSMLTGQRALDLGSLERLTWHIDQVAIALNMKEPEV